MAMQAGEIERLIKAHIPDAQVTIRDLAGAFTLVGCAAAILGEVEAIVEYMRLTPPRSRADD